MKKFTMLGVPLLVFLAAMTQASFSAETKKAGGETAKILAIGEVSTFQSDCSGLNANFIAEKMNEIANENAMTVLKKDEAKNNAEITATVEGLINVIDKNVALNVSLQLMKKNTAATNFDAMEVQGIMPPDETVLVSNSKKTGTKNKVGQNNNCNCASCIEMTKYATMSIGGNSA